MSHPERSEGNGLANPDQPPRYAQGDTRAVHAPWDVQCLNCEAPLTGPFCAQCGQRAVPPHPTVRELAGDAVAEFSGWDGKFAETVRTLIRRPGELTRQWLEGRRAHFISPLRLYLTASVLFFIVQSSAPRLDNETERSFGVDTRTNPGKASAAVSEAMDDVPLTGEKRDSALAAVEKAPWIVRSWMKRMILDPEGFKSRLKALVPRMFFALLPLYAGLLALFYRRRHYPEHLYFAIHLHAFVFIALMLVEATKFARSATLSSAVGIAIMAWIVIYALRSLRTVYGGSWPRTIVKGIGIMTLYFFIAMPVMALTIALAGLL